MRLFTSKGHDSRRRDSQAQHFANVISNLVLHDNLPEDGLFTARSVRADLEYVFSLSSAQLANFLDFASTHHAGSVACCLGERVARQSSPLVSGIV